MRKLAFLLPLMLAGCVGSPIVIDASAVAKIERDWNIGVTILCNGVAAEQIVANDPSLGPPANHYIAQNPKVGRDIAIAAGLCRILGKTAPAIVPLATGA